MNRDDTMTQAASRPIHYHYIVQRLGQDGNLTIYTEDGKPKGFHAKKCALQFASILNEEYETCAASMGPTYRWVAASDNLTVEAPGRAPDRS